MITRRSFAAGSASLLAAPMISPRAARAAAKWRHAILASKGDAGFFFMAKHKGFWAKRGLDVDIIELKGSKDGMRAVLAGGWEPAPPTPGGGRPGPVKGPALQLCWPHIDGHPYAVDMRPPLHSLGRGSRQH